MITEDRKKEMLLIIDDEIRQYGLSDNHFIEIIEFYINEFELNDDYHFGYGEYGITTCSGKFKIKPFLSYGKKQLDINQEDILNYKKAILREEKINKILND